METGKVNTILQQLSTEKHQWWGTQKYEVSCKDAKLLDCHVDGRRSDRARLSRGRPVSCWVVSDWMPTCSLSRSQCPVASGLWLLLLTQDVLLCCVLLCWCPGLSQECDTATLHWTEAAIFASGCQHHLSTLSEVRTQRRSIVRRLARKGEWGGRFVITVNTWPGLHTPIHGETRLRWGSYWATSKYFKGHGTETLVLVFAITTFFSRSFYAVQFS